MKIQFEYGSVINQSRFELEAALLELDHYKLHIQKELDRRGPNDVPVYAVYCSTVGGWVGHEDFGTAVELAKEYFPNDKEEIGYRLQKIYRTKDDQ